MIDSVSYFSRTIVTVVLAELQVYEDALRLLHEVNLFCEFYSWTKKKKHRIC